MSFFTLVRVELKKLRRSRLLPLLLLAAVVLWTPSVLNARLNFQMQAEGISPENSYFIQGFLGLCWFMFPACAAVCTALLDQTERERGGLEKMLSLPVSPAGLCLAKFAVLLLLAAGDWLLNAGVYALSGALASRLQGYELLLPPGPVLALTGRLWAASAPMLACFWALAVCVRSRIVSLGIALASIVPSVLLINTRLWFAYPMDYPFFLLTAEYGRLAENMSTAEVEPLPWLPTAGLVTLLALTLACRSYGRRERR